MSLYNALFGVNPATFLILPMLGKHPDEYPRFRDCFVGTDGPFGHSIVVYTRVGGNNRNTGYGEEWMLEHPDFIKTYDDDFDSTYGSYVFNVPKRWREDFLKIIDGKLAEISDDYFNEILRVYPTLEERVREVFKRPKE